MGLKFSHDKACGLVTTSTGPEKGKKAKEGQASRAGTRLRGGTSPVMRRGSLSAQLTAGAEGHHGRQRLGQMEEA